MRMSPPCSAAHAQSGCWTVLIVIALIWIGGQGAYTAYKNPQPLVIGYDDYVKTRPAAQWLILTNCTLDIPGAIGGAHVATKEIKQVSIPLRGKSQDPFVHVVYVTKHPMYCRTFSEILKRSQTSHESVNNWVRNNTQHAYPKLDVRGLADSIHIYKSSGKQEGLNYAEGAISIEEGSKPNLPLHLAVLIIGLVWAAVGFRKWRSDDGLIAPGAKK